MMRRLPLIILAVLALVAVGCRRVPSHVIAPDDMAELLADIYVGESYVEVNRREFPTDSTRQALKQSIFIKHGVTQEQFDTSMVWYGRHIDKYLDMYDHTVEILTERQALAGTRAMEMARSVAGDSVDIWNGTPYAIISPRLPSKMLSFSMRHDENWEPGDEYIWRVKVLNSDQQAMRYTILAEYEDSTLEMFNTAVAGRDWLEIRFITDSTRRAVAIRGLFDPGQIATTLWIDSISLVRKRLNAETYNSFHSRQRRYPNPS